MRDKEIIKEIIGKKITKVKSYERDNNDYDYPEKILFEILFEDGDKLEFLHSQECCEDIYFESYLEGGVKELVESKIIDFEISNNKEHEKYSGDAMEWTFYKMKTTKGYTTLRFYGTSNGYYATNVDIRIIKKGDKNEKK